MTNGTWMKGFVAGSAVGVAAGVLAGVLYAPDKGTRTRRQIARKAEHLGERASEAFHSANELVERGRRRVGL